MKRRLTFREHILLASILPLFMCFCLYWHLHHNHSYPPLASILVGMTVQFCLGELVNRWVASKLGEEVDL